MTKLWKKLDVVESPPVFMTPTDDCYYARDYISHGSYKASEANQLISNFKKHPKHKGTSSWRYKEAAIDQFAREIAQVLGKSISVAAIPPSKLPEDPEYDSRLADCLARLKQIRPDLTVERPFVCRESTVPSHHGGSRRIDEIAANLKWRGLSVGCQTLVLVDDVLTTGAHYQACKRILAREAAGVRVAGLFWARTVWPEDENPFEAIDA